MKKEKNKQRKWFRYLLELLVVFIGVTAGFLLNTWREEQADLKLEQKYLEGFYADILLDQDNLDSLILHSQYKTDTMIGIIKLSEAVNKPLTEELANIIVQEIIYIEWFSPTNDTYKDIINSGNLNLISNFKLKEKISSYYSIVDEVKNVEKYYENHMTNYGFPFLFKNYYLYKSEFANEESYLSLEFTNMYLGAISFIQQNNQIYRRTLTKNLELQEALLQIISTNK